MIRSPILLTITALLCLAGNSSAGMLTPHLSLSVEGGATRSYLKTEKLMTSFFAPTSGVEESIRPAAFMSINLSLGNYLGIASGLGYLHFGQSTAPTTVFLKNDIFEHDFESHVLLDYFSVPFILKAGIRRPFFSIFLRCGFIPSLLVNDDVAWIIDHRKVEEGSSRMPDVAIKRWDAPLHLGGEAGFHFGKNGVFLVGHYNYGFHDIATGIPGRAFNRSYGATVQYRRELF